MHVYQKEEAFPWAGRPLHSPSADSDTESYLLERGAEALPLTQVHHFMKTDADARRERSNEREAPGQTAFVVACIAF